MLCEPVRVGIIGCDGYALGLLKRLWTIPHDAKVTAATSPAPDTDGTRACRGRGVPVYSSVDDMLEAGGFEAVINAAPIHLHAPLSKACLEAGFPVWMEKPPSPTIQDLDRLVDVSVRKARPVAVGFNTLYATVARELKQELVRGRYGRVRRVRGVGAWTRGDTYFSRNNWAGRVRLGDDWVLDGSINNPFAHVICNGLFFAAPEQHALADPVSVEAELYRANHIETEDTSSLRVITREGVEVLTHFTLAPEQDIVATTVIETEGAVLRLEDFATIHIAWKDGRTEVRESYRENRIEMLQHLCRAVRVGERYHCDLPMCRPFTVVVNAAFDASGEVHPIPEAVLYRHEDEGGPAVAVRGINDLLLQAHESGRLLSEIGVPWARACEKQDVKSYSAFPRRFSVSP